MDYCLAAMGGRDELMGASVPCLKFARRLLSDCPPVPSTIAPYGTQYFVRIHEENEGSRHEGSHQVSSSSVNLPWSDLT